MIHSNLRGLALKPSVCAKSIIYEIPNPQLYFLKQSKQQTREQWGMNGVQ